MPKSEYEKFGFLLAVSIIVFGCIGVVNILFSPPFYIILPVMVVAVITVILLVSKKFT